MEENSNVPSAAVIKVGEIGDTVIKRIQELCEAGFTMPADYNYVNAIKMSYLKIAEVKDKNGKRALEVCTPASIQTALFKMVTRGLNMALDQCYPIVRGDQLCIDPSYFGQVLLVKRIYPDWEPFPVVIHEGDEFVYKIDAESGRKVLIKHEQSLENIDKDFVGAYMYIPSKQGPNLYVMTKKQIMTAWSKSPSQQGVHKQFTEKMISKTIVNSGCRMVINSTPELNGAGEPDDEEPQNEVRDLRPSEFQEVKEAPAIEEKPQVAKPKPRPVVKKEEPAEAPAEAAPAAEAPQPEAPAEAAAPQSGNAQQGNIDF